MALIGIISDSQSSLNKKIVMLAAKKAPSLVIDCANAADLHSLYPKIPLENLTKVYVVELEVLYKFRDVLKKAQAMLNKLSTNRLFITTSDYLFNYHDDEENKHITLQCWSLMMRLAKANKVIVGIAENQREFANYCDKVYYYGPHSIKPTSHGGYCTGRIERIW